ncbi:hypothetical protein B0H17DRAFT_1255934 [Mycena rosella]|uniref:Uncharacterized protein n=1 Tax=Mycena rosella TaxID=1033263 RepID=A0AAD7DWM5_MYCRO|nr:hypothetical protein B0H17DRAFT_1255934 [Mycena rosella]
MRGARGASPLVPTRKKTLMKTGVSTQTSAETKPELVQDDPTTTTRVAQWASCARMPANCRCMTVAQNYGLAFSFRFASSFKTSFHIFKKILKKGNLVKRAQGVECAGRSSAGAPPGSVSADLPTGPTTCTKTLSANGENRSVESRASGQTPANRGCSSDGGSTLSMPALQTVLPSVSSASGIEGTRSASTAPLDTSNCSVYFGMLLRAASTCAAFNLAANSETPSASQGQVEVLAQIREATVDVLENLSFTSLVNPPSSTLGSAVRLSAEDYDSITVALFANCGHARIFVSLAQEIEVYDEDLSSLLLRYHPVYNPLTDDGPLLPYGAVDGDLPGKTSKEIMLLRDVVITSMGLDKVYMLGAYHLERLAQLTLAIHQVLSGLYEFLDTLHSSLQFRLTQAVQHIKRQFNTIKHICNQELDVMSSLLVRPNYRVQAYDSLVWEQYVEKFTDGSRLVFYKDPELEHAAALTLPFSPKPEGATSPEIPEKTAANKVFFDSGAQCSAHFIPTVPMPTSLSSVGRGPVSILPGMELMPQWPADITPAHQQAFNPGMSIGDATRARSTPSALQELGKAEPIEACRRMERPLLEEVEVEDPQMEGILPSAECSLEVEDLPLHAEVLCNQLSYRADAGSDHKSPSSWPPVMWPPGLLVPLHRSHLPAQTCDTTRVGPGPPHQRLEAMEVTAQRLLEDLPSDMCDGYSKTAISYVCKISELVRLSPQMVVDLGAFTPLKFTGRAEMWWDPPLYHSGVSRPELDLPPSGDPSTFPQRQLASRVAL